MMPMTKQCQMISDEFRTLLGELRDKDQQLRELKQRESGMQAKVVKLEEELRAEAKIVRGGAIGSLATSGSRDRSWPRAANASMDGKAASREAVAMSHLASASASRMAAKSAKASRDAAHKAKAEATTARRKDHADCLRALFPGWGRLRAPSVAGRGWRKKP